MFKNLKFKRIYIAPSCTEEAFEFLGRVPQMTETLKSSFLNAKNNILKKVTELILIDFKISNVKCCSFQYI